MQSGLERDFIIRIVLDQFVEISQLDPSCVSPDCNLKEEYGLKDGDMQLILNHSIRKANLMYPDENLPQLDTLREIVSLLMTLDVKAFENAA